MVGAGRPPPAAGARSPAGPGSRHAQGEGPRSLQEGGDMPDASPGPTLTAGVQAAPRRLRPPTLGAAAGCPPPLGAAPWPRQQRWGWSTVLTLAARARGVGLSAVQLTGRPCAARARAVVGPMAANCRGRGGPQRCRRTREGDARGARGTPCLQDTAPPARASGRGEAAGLAPASWPGGSHRASPPARCEDTRPRPGAGRLGRLGRAGGLSCDRSASCLGALGEVGCYVE